MDEVKNMKDDSQKNDGERVNFISAQSKEKEENDLNKDLKGHTSQKGCSSVSLPSEGSC